MCDRGAAAVASEKLAKVAAPKWTDIAREIAVEFRANPMKYGDGSGSLRSWVIGDAPERGFTRAASQGPPSRS